MENILAIDLGRKTMGLALSRTGLIVTPLDNPHFDIDCYDENIEYLKDLFLDEHIDNIVIGYPLYPSGDPCKMTPIVDNFIVLLEKNFPNVKIYKQDERNSTSVASAYLHENGYNSKKQRKIIDKTAACIILQRFLDKIND